MRFFLAIPWLLSLSACSARQSNDPPGFTQPDAQPDYDVNRISIPFLVDDHYIPSGCMGDCVTNVTIDNDCPVRGTVDAQGECHHFVFTSAAGNLGALGWAGVLWQTTEKNWGSLPGRQVDPGATQVQFYVSGKVGGEKLDIVIGGMTGGDAGKSCTSDDTCASGVCAAGACTMPHQDTLNVLTPIVLGSEFQKVEVPFGNHDYGSEVLSGFGWSAKMPASATSLEFYVDDVRWE